MQYTYVQPTSFINFGYLFSLIKGLFLGLFTITFLEVLYVLGILIVIALITLILFLFVRFYEMYKEDEKKKKPIVTARSMPTGSPISDAVVTKAASNPVWKHIREELLSDNNSDWKLAIIEADIYMDRVIDDKGFHGDTTGDKLKQITPDKLPSVQIAWEVHKVRNRIAHEGSAFVLTKPEARRLLSYYEIIFTDLEVI